FAPHQRGCDQAAYRAGPRSRQGEQSPQQPWTAYFSAETILGTRVVHWLQKADVLETMTDLGRQIEPGLLLDVRREAPRDSCMLGSESLHELLTTKLLCLIRRQVHAMTALRERPDDGFVVAEVREMLCAKEDAHLRASLRAARLRLP